MGMGFVFNGTGVEVKVAEKNKQWFVVHTFSGMEKTVLKNLEERIKQAGMVDSFGRILVPVEEVVEIRKGQKSISERRFFPGYVLVEMEMNEQTWHLMYAFLSFPFLLYMIPGLSTILTHTK